MSYESIAKAEVSIDSSFLLGTTSAQFDAILLKPSESKSLDPYMLKIILRINLQQLNPSAIPVTRDSDGRLIFIRQWKDNEWLTFISQAKRQADLWANNFWLKPPPTCTDYDVPIPGSKKAGTNPFWRPYINCWLMVDFKNTTAGAHTIKVANVNVDKINLDNIGKRHASTPDFQSFRSSAVLWDSLDGVPSFAGFMDDQGTAQAESHSTIAHEIGHLLGLQHIGVILKRPLCQLAVTLENIGVPGSWQVVTENGTASEACYGYYSPASIGANIMGYGINFSVENGMPWAYAMTTIRKAPFEHWEVLMKDVHSENGTVVNR